LKNESNKKLILFLLILLSSLNGIGQNILIADFKIEEDSSIIERARILDERSFFISPNEGVDFDCWTQTYA
jgi:hypothetical protein